MRGAARTLGAHVVRAARRAGVALLLLASAACGDAPPESASTRMAREIRGVWVSAALERAVSKAGDVTWRRRVFDLGERDFRLTIDVFGDEAAKDRRMTLEFTGPYHVGAPSPTVAGAVEAELGHAAWYLTPRSPALLARLAQAGCTDAPWRLNERQDVSARGCLGLASVADCRQEYDVLAIRDGRLVFGERTGTPCRPELRLSRLSTTDAFERTTRTYAEVLAAWDAATPR